MSQLTLFFTHWSDIPTYRQVFGYKRKADDNADERSNAVPAKMSAIERLKAQRAAKRARLSDVTNGNANAEGNAVSSA